MVLRVHMRFAPRSRRVVEASCLDPGKVSKSHFHHFFGGSE